MSPQNQRYTKEKLLSLKRTAERIKIFHRHLKDMGQYLHEGQIPIAKKALDPAVRDITAQCGRSFGKSHLLRYIICRAAIEHPGWACYLYAFERNQAYEVHWSDPTSSIRAMIPREFLLGEESINKTDLRITLDNGSFIKLDGIDSSTGKRGIKPNILGADEIQEWPEDGYVAMYPNLIAKSAKIIKVGTPPDAENFYIRLRAFVLDEIKKGNKRYFYTELPTWHSPRMPKEEIEQIRKEFSARGEEAAFRREYGAEYVPGGASAIYPNWSKEFVKEHDVLLAVLNRDKHKLHWYAIFDPGTTTTFAALFACHNPYTNDLYLLDEIYERDPKQTRTVPVWLEADRIKATLYPNSPRDIWRNYYDEAAAWFLGEVSYNFGVALFPTQKATATKLSNISLIKDIMAHNKLHVSQKCVNFVTEIESYCLDKNGNLPKLHDHLMDCLNYLVAACGYTFIGRPNEDKQRYGLFEKLNGQVLNVNPKDDWTDFIDQSSEYFIGEM